jgi:GNAT superfamily N-acetyltransferase
VVFIREASASDWPRLELLIRAVVADGRSIAWPEDLTSAQAQRLWLPGPPERTVFAVDTDGRILGSAMMGPNRPGRGAHIATATFIVDEAVRGHGVGRALGEHVLAWARAGGYVGIQFNAVVETNTAAARLWTSLGMRIVGTVPQAFRHPIMGLSVCTSCSSNSTIRSRRRASTTAPLAARPCGAAVSTGAMSPVRWWRRIRTWSP